MKEEGDFGFFVLGLFMALLICFLIALSGGCEPATAWEAQIVEKGHGHYVNDKYHRPKFEYLPPCKKVECK